MGMSASQARLLFITSRQNDVSAKMQRISNQNMILARDSDEVAEKYNNMLNNPTKTIQLKSGYNLNYNEMMGIAGANKGYDTANVVTDAYGKVVLSSTLATTYGLPATGDVGAITSIYPTAKDFITKVAGADVAAEVTDASGVSSKKETVSGTEETLSFNDIARLMGVVGENTTLGTDRDFGISKETARNLTWERLLNSGNPAECCFLLESFGDSKNFNGGPQRDAAAMSRLNDLLKAMGSALKIGLKNYNVTSEQIDRAVNNTYNHYCAGGVSEKVRSEKEKHASMGDDGLEWDTIHKVRYAVSTNKPATYQFGVNGKELLKTLLACLYNEIKADGQPAYIGTENPSYNLTLINKSKKPTTEKSEETVASNKTKASYYASIYEQLKNGWVIDDTVTNASTLNEKLKNGTYQINNAPIGESNMYETVIDSEYKAKAEAYYDTEKNKIQRKEKQLETELTKLQTEYSSLTNDYNSVKTILDANIQRSFTYCQNG